MKYDGYQRGMVSMVYGFYDEKCLAGQLKMNLCLIKNYQKNYTNQLLENLRIESTVIFHRQYLGC